MENGGHLVHITDSKEQSVLFDIAREYHRKKLWIGLHDSNEEGTYEWISGKGFSFLRHESGDFASDH